MTTSLAFVWLAVGGPVLGVGGVAATCVYMIGACVIDA